MFKGIAGLLTKLQAAGAGITLGYAIRLLRRRAGRVVRPQPRFFDDLGAACRGRRSCQRRVKASITLIAQERCNRSVCFVYRFTHTRRLRCSRSVCSGRSSRTAPRWKPFCQFPSGGCPAKIHRCLRRSRNCWRRRSSMGRSSRKNPLARWRHHKALVREASRVVRDRRALSGGRAVDCASSSVPPCLVRGPACCGYAQWD